MMTYSYTADIAGMDFAIKCRYPLSHDKLPVSYSQFIKETINPEPAFTVNVVVSEENMRQSIQMKKVFDTGQSWSMFRKGDRHLILLDTPAPQIQPLWLAEFDMRQAYLSVYCSSSQLSIINSTETLCTPFSYPLDQLLLMHLLSQKEGILIHAAGIAINDRGVVFPGRSGAGKSTISRLFLAKDNVKMLSDDRIIIRKIDGQFRIFGTPWAGDAEIAENRNMLFESIFFIHHCDVNKIEDLKPKDAAKRLMPVTSIPWYDETAIGDIFSIIEEIVSAVPAYDLYFRPESTTSDFLEDFILRNTTDHRQMV